MLGAGGLKRFWAKGAVSRPLACAAALAALAACSPQDAADAVARQAAASVAIPLVERFMQPAQAAGVVNCLLDAATPSEIRGLAQNVGTSGGTIPLQTLITVASRPQAISCVASAGLPRLPGAV